MKVYLAGQYKQKEELRERAADLWQANIMCTSSWLKEPYDPKCTMDVCAEEQLREIAETDLNDIRRSDAIIFFSVSETELTRRGGRHVEFGYALALDKRILVVGPKENIFHYLTDIEVFPDFKTAVERLRRK